MLSNSLLDNQRLTNFVIDMLSTRTLMLKVIFLTRDTFLVNLKTVNCGLQVDFLNLKKGCPRAVMVKVTDYGIVVSEFVLQLHY